jgi:2-amino-4-hydroxy-6-hydroxymethyldihydropteridine diphosphokinase
VAGVDTPVAVALGSNLGDRLGHLIWAAEQLRTVLAASVVAPIIETDAVDVPDDQPPYLNTVVVGTTALAAPALLASLLALEQARGRVRPGVRAPRTLDLDLILFGDLVLNEAGLVVPHPRFRERRFVLEPLAAVAGEWRDPVTGARVVDLLVKLKD